MDLLEGLNPEQKEAVTTTEGPLLILAGAGSGKTRVLTHRIAYILEKKLASPEQILAVTFTNKAAGEMKERISDLIKKPTARSPQSTAQNSQLFWAGTFHSTCVKILKREGARMGLNNNFTIYDSNDSLDVVKEAMDRLLISKKDFNPYAIRSSISSAKNELITSSKYQELADGYFQDHVAKIYPEYQKILHENQAVDFDDLIMKTVQLFNNHPDVLEKYKNIFRYIHVDEYQDTNHAQYVLIRQLSERNICVVGDDDQSIYGFRGANIQNIMNFEKDFENTKVIKLERNYRSTQTILDASHSVVSLNENRRDKKLWTDKKSKDLIEIYTAIDEGDEANWVAEQCDNLIASKVEPYEIAILYRTNAQSRTIEESFIRNDLPYKIVGSIRFYDRKEIKDILAYLKILANPSDTLCLERIINVPRRGIGAKTFSNLKTTAKSLNQSPTEFLVNESDAINSPKVKAFAEILQDILKTMENCELTELIKYILERSGYIKFLDDGSLESQGRIENLKELISVASRYDDQECIVGLRSFLEDVSLLEDMSARDKDNNNTITLMTIHASKGLEFKHIFIIGMEEMIFPHSRSYTDPREMAEERRLAYVAITRAKQYLRISHAQSRMYFGKLQANPISRFVEDIPTKLIVNSSSRHVLEEPGNFIDHYFEEEAEIDYDELGLETGQKVKHEIFGKGKVVDINESTITIDFGIGKGEKELALEYARLEKI